MIHLFAGFRQKTGLRSGLSVQVAVPSAPNLRLHDRFEVDEFRIDEQTHDDLNLDDVYKTCNKTCTSFGDEMFYHRLHTILPAEKIAAVIRETQALAVSDTERVFVQRRLVKMGKQVCGSFMNDVWDGLKYRSFLTENIILIELLNISQVILVSFLLPHFLFYSIMLFVMLNITINLLTTKHIGNCAASINYFIRGCLFLKKYRKKFPVRLADHFPEVERFERLAWCSLLFREGVGIEQMQDILSLIIDYLRVFFGLEAISYKLTTDYISKNIDGFRRVITYLGELDCLLNNTVLIESQSMCYPVFHTGGDTEPGEYAISCRQLRHPLLEKSIPQDVDIGSNLIITGMNMSGKSTFMKSLALSHLFASGFGLAFAQEFHTRPYQLITSLRLADDITSNKSKYYVEAERLVFIRHSLEAGPVLCLIDEILTGTNTDDRICASIAILQAFAQYQDSLVIAATHDVSIAGTLSDQYENRHFDGEIDGEQIRFDYLLKPGIVSRKNGLLILKYLGLDVEA